MHTNGGLVSVFQVGFGFSVFFEVGLVFGVGVSKYHDISIHIAGILSPYVAICS